jgi:1,5-anhydro-D-fructose reductase (1,5-anhydro-D-mannitol-forming)
MTPPATASSPIRIAVVGAGLIGTQRAGAIRGIPDALLAATVDPLATPPEGMDAPHLSSVDELDPDAYDAAVISVPHHMAAGLAEGILRSGKPILIEKPLGITGEQARELERLADEVDRPSFVGYNYRYLPAISGLVTSILAGEIGALRNLDLVLGHGGHPGSAAGWKLDPEQAGGGVLLDPGVHLLDLLLAIAPNATCVDIEATRGFWETGIEEDVVATFRDGQLIATVRSSHIRWVNTFRVEAFAEEGYLVAEGRGGNYGPMTLRHGRRWGWRDPGVASQRESERTSDFGTRDGSLAAELQAVVATWRSPPADATAVSGFPRPATMAEARRITELCETLYRRIGGRSG